MSSKTGYVAKTAAVLGAVATAQRMYTENKTRWDARRKHTLSIEEDAYVFIPLMQWIMEHNKDTKHHRLLSYSNRQYTILDPSNQIEFELDGYMIKLESNDDKPKMQSNEHGELDITKPQVVFSCSSQKGIDSLTALCESLREHKSTKAKEVIGYNRASYGWNGRDLPVRNIDHIYLDRGDKEALMSDLERFLSQEDKYEAIGTPWHRGYLLYGKPGNGKTSLVQGLAHYYKRHVYNLALSSVASDSVLLEAVRDVQPGSFLLVEDIDIFRESVVREGTKSTGPTLAGLLNAFDGINTPHGLVTFFTTNVIETLDTALIRPGRMDYHLELRAPTRHQVETMFNGVYGEELGTKPRDFESMAAFVDVLKQHMDDPETARLDIKDGF